MYSAYCSVGNTILSGYLSLRSSYGNKHSNVLYLSRRQFTSSILKSSCRMGAILSILHIVQLRAYSKVRWITALCIITLMKNIHVRRNWSLTKLVGQTMCAEYVIPQGEVSISLFRGIGVPFPTIRWIRGAIDFIPKAFHSDAPKKMPLKAAIRTIAMQQNCALRGI
jgi:hypothetical protein